MNPIRTRAHVNAVPTPPSRRKGPKALPRSSPRRSTGAAPHPAYPGAPARGAGMPFEALVRRVAEAVYRRAYVEILKRELSYFEMRSVRHWEQTMDLYARVLNLERALARRPELRKVIESLPVNLKARSTATVPFPEPLWSRAGRKDPEMCLARTPTGARVRPRVDLALAYLRAHPRARIEKVAQRFRVLARTIYQSTRYREILHEHGLAKERLRGWFRGNRSTAVDRALALLQTHRPRSMYELARLAGTKLSSIYRSGRFRQAWREYAANADGGTRNADRTADGNGTTQRDRERQEVAENGGDLWRNGGGGPARSSTGASCGRTCRTTSGSSGRGGSARSVGRGTA